MLITQLLYTHGIFYGLAALLLALLYVINEMYYMVAGSGGRRAQLVTGLVGTPVHELSHAMACVMFAMKVKAIAFYKPDPCSGSLGYVQFTYNPVSIFHRVGLVIVGVSPLISGVIVISAAVFWLGMPGISDNYLTFFENNATIVIIRNYYYAMGSYIIGDLRNALTVLVVSSVVMHSTPSAADLRNCVRGLVVFALAGMALSATLSFVDFLWVAQKHALVTWFSYLVNRILEMLLIAAGVVGAAGCIRMIFAVVTRGKAVIRSIKK